MKNSKRIEIAKEFISLHKNDDVYDWFAMLPGTANSDEDKYSQVYYRLEDGTYGDVTDNTEYDDDGEIVAEPTEFKIEISRFDSKSGNPITYEWSA